MFNEQFPFEEEDFEFSDKILSDNKVKKSHGLVYMPYIMVEKTPTIEESDMTDYFHKRLKYASKIPVDRFEKIKIK